MPKFTNLEGQQLQYGNPAAYDASDEKAFLMSFEKQIRTADMKNPDHVKAVQSNFNEIATLIGFNHIPVHGTVDTTTADAINYYKENRGTFMKYGISNHLKAIDLEKTTAPAFTDTEYAPTIEEMKALDFNMGDLHDRSQDTTKAY